MSEPTRLKDDPQVLAAMREDLERVQGVEPRAYDTNAGLARLQSGIATATTSSALKAGLWPWMTAGLVSATLIGYAVTHSGRSPATHVTPAVTRSEHVEPVKPSVIAPTIIAPTTLDDSQPTLQPSAAVAVATTSSTSHETDPDARLRLETAHLARARAALEHSAADALRLAQQGQRRFAGGMFDQERQAIIVLSSLRLRQASAQTAARAFLDQFPHSPLSDRIRDELAHVSEKP